MKKVCGWILLSASCFLLAGCAGLTRRIAVTEAERNSVMAAFQSMMTRQSNCGCLDAEVDAAVNIPRWIGGRSLLFSGYLQAESPSALKFTGLNPLGQPVYILLLEGWTFQSVLVEEAKVYEGDIRSTTFLKYAPAGLRGNDVFSWLSGEPPADFIDIASIQANDSTRDSYWLGLTGPDRDLRQELEFDPGAEVVRRRVLFDQDGAVSLEAEYEGYIAVGSCLLPGEVRFKSRTRRSSVSMTMKNMVECKNLPSAVFRPLTPTGFEKVVVD